MIVKILIKI